MKTQAKKKKTAALPDKVKANQTAATRKKASEEKKAIKAVRPEARKAAPSTPAEPAPSKPTERGRALKTGSSAEKTAPRAAATPEKAQSLSKPSEPRKPLQKRRPRNLEEPTESPAEEPVESPEEEGPSDNDVKPRKSLKADKSGKSEDSDKSLVKFDPLQRYLSEISKYRLLTREEERDYGLRVREQGDKEAAYALVTANLRLVVKIALEFQRVWMQNLLDLIQEGNIGLMQAVKKFDPYKNVKFSYYASFWIKAYILKFIMDNWRLVKIGTTQGQRKLFFKLKKEKQRLIDQGFDPKPKLLSERLGVSEREIVDMDQRLDSWDVSLDAPLKNDSETERIEFLSTENESVEEQVSKKEIELLLHNKITEFRKKMTPREIEIFELRIFSDNPVTLQEIGDRYGISRERVRQVEKNIIRKMRDFFKREIPDFASYAEDTGME